jgi:hypothetical protein
MSVVKPSKVSKEEIATEKHAAMLLHKSEVLRNDTLYY